MSIPAIRTALREAESRPTSPSSQSVISEVSSPIPYSRISARQPVWHLANRRKSRSKGAIWASIASIIASAISIRSRASAGTSSASRNARPSPVRSFSGLPPMPC
jgi:hypothetical protein